MQSQAMFRESLAYLQSEPAPGYGWLRFRKSLFILQVQVAFTQRLDLSQLFCRASLAIPKRFLFLDTQGHC